MRLRPYKSCDAKIIASWVKTEDVFLRWGGDHFGAYPIDSTIIDNKYMLNNGDCKEEDNFYPFVALDDDNNVVGHFIMRYIHGNNRILRFGWVIVDDSIRGKGIGTSMLKKGLEYAFNIFGVDVVTLGVYDNNSIAHECYKKAGFKDKEIVSKQPNNIIEMEIFRQDYIK